MAAHPQARPARVVEQHRSGYIVADGPGEGSAVESLPERQRPSGSRQGSSSQDQSAAVGDWVLLDGKRIVDLLPRRTAIQREVGSACGRAIVCQYGEIQVAARYYKKKKTKND